MVAAVAQVVETMVMVATAAAVILPVHQVLPIRRHSSHKSHHHRNQSLNLLRHHRQSRNLNPFLNPLLRQVMRAPVVLVAEVRAVAAAVPLLLLHPNHRQM
jgi:hypothetical protein